MDLGLGKEKARGKPKITLVQVVKNDLSVKEVRESTTSNRIK